MLQGILNVVEQYDQYIAIVVILLTLAEAIANLTPTEKDNSVILKIKTWFDILIPNRAKTGKSETTGTHKIGSRIIERLKNRKK